MIPELLAPAGSLEKLKVAVTYGADAVYLGGRHFSLRAGAGNFDEKKWPKDPVCSSRAPGLCNSKYFARNSDLVDLRNTFTDLFCEVDGIIVSDRGLSLMSGKCIRNWPSTSVHRPIQTGLQRSSGKNSVFQDCAGGALLDEIREIGSRWSWTWKYSFTAPCVLLIPGAAS